MKCFYHNSDLDGHCSGALVKIEFPECEMIGINYGDEFPWDSIEKNEIVYMVDFSLEPFVDMIELNKKCHLVWIDHHKTAMDEYVKWFNRGYVINGIRSIEYAACELVYKYFYLSSDNYIPYFIRLLGRYDIWDLEWSKNVLPFQMGMRNYDTDPILDKAIKNVWKPLLTENNNSKKAFLNKIIKEGKIILSYQNKYNEKYLNAAAFETKFSYYKAIAINKALCNSKVFDTVVKNKYHIFITFYRNKNHKWVVTLYSNTVDVGRLAKEYGGGGHMGAAGFVCDELPFDY